jgi:hypothetical protein
MLPDFKGIILMPLAQVTLHNRAHFEILKDFKFHVATVFYSSRKTNLTDEINKKIAIFQASGLIRYWTKIFNPDQNNLIRNITGRESRTLTLHHMKIAFDILLFGCMLAGIIFIVEKIYFKLTQK